MSGAGNAFDVVVAGAGPGGATIATLLARAGHSVLVLEKAEFPRFQIGESLLPACMPVLERLGVEPDPDTFVFKRGAEFVCEDSERAEVFPFDEALDGCPPHAWHVDRSRFDMQLRDLARDAGCDVRHGCVVDKIDANEHEVRVTFDAAKGTDGSAGEVTARYFVDATGQNRLLARRHSTVQHNDRFGRAAAFTHYEGLGDAYDEVFRDVGDIRIMIRKDGWGWIIPLPHRRLSIGLVSKDRVGEAELESGLLAGPLATKLTAGATRGGTRIVGNYSYDNTAPHGVRYTTVGDARSFIDPVFSSGVTLAMRSANELADIVSAALEDDREADPDLCADHRASMQRAYDTFAALVGRFYHGSFAESFFLRRMPDYEMRRGIMSVLAGDVWRRDNPFQDMLLRSRTARKRASGTGAPLGSRE